MAFVERDLVGGALEAPARRGRVEPERSGDPGQLGVSAPAAGRARRAPARRPPHDAAAVASCGVDPHALAARVVHAGTGAGAPSSPDQARRGRRRTAPGGRRSRASAAAPPACSTASSTVAPAATSSSTPSTVTRISPAPAPRGSARAGCGSAPACRRRGRTGSPPRASPAAPSSALAVDRRVGLEHLVRPSQADPAGEALAAALVGAEAQQVARERAHVGALVEADDAAVSDHAALGRERVEVERRVELPRRAGSRRAGRRSGPP